MTILNPNDGLRGPLEERGSRQLTLQAIPSWKADVPLATGRFLRPTRGDSLLTLHTILLVPIEPIGGTVTAPKTVCLHGPSYDDWF